MGLGGVAEADEVAGELGDGGGFGGAVDAAGGGGIDLHGDGEGVFDPAGFRVADGEGDGDGGGGGAEAGDAGGEESVEIGGRGGDELGVGVEGGGLDAGNAEVAEVAVVVTVGDEAGVGADEDALDGDVPCVDVAAVGAEVAHREDGTLLTGVLDDGEVAIGWGGEDDGRERVDGGVGVRVRGAGSAGEGEEEAVAGVGLRGAGEVAEEIACVMCGDDDAGGEPIVGDAPVDVGVVAFVREREVAAELAEVAADGGDAEVEIGGELGLRPGALTDEAFEERDDDLRRSSLSCLPALDLSHPVLLPGRYQRLDAYGGDRLCRPALVRCQHTARHRLGHKLGVREEGVVEDRVPLVEPDPEEKGALASVDGGEARLLMHGRGLTGRERALSPFDLLADLLGRNL